MREKLTLTATQLLQKSKINRQTFIAVIANFQLYQGIQRLVPIHNYLMRF